MRLFLNKYYCAMMEEAKRAVVNEYHKKLRFFSGFKIIFFEVFSIGIHSYFVVQSDTNKIFISKKTHSNEELKLTLEIDKNVTSLCMNDSLALGNDDGTCLILSRDQIVNGATEASFQIVTLNLSSIKQIVPKKIQKGGAAGAFLILHQDNSLSVLSQSIEIQKKEGNSQKPENVTILQKSQKWDLSPISSNIPVKILQYYEAIDNIPETCEYIVYLKNSVAPIPMTTCQFNDYFPSKIMEIANESALYYSQTIEEEYKDLELIEYEPMNNTLIMSSRGKVYVSNVLKISREEGNTEEEQYLKHLSHEIQISFAFEEPGHVLSLQVLKKQFYLCVSTIKRVLFLDLKKKNKFFPPLKQKETSPINQVRWTKDEHMLLVAAGIPDSKVYIYSRELPIRFISC